MTDAVDVVIVGAGPAGLSAARAAADAGADVLLLDEQLAPGGQVWREARRRLSDPQAAFLAGDSDQGAARALSGLDRPGIVYVPGATLTDATPDRRVTWLAPPGEAPRLRETQAGALILASGAQERPVPFPGWTLPGVMGVGALQLLLKQGVVPQGRIVIAGHGPLVLLTLKQLRRAKARLVAMLDFGKAMPPASALRYSADVVADPGLFAKGLALAAGRAMSGIPLHREVRCIEAHGSDELRAVAFRSKQGATREIECDLLAVHDGVIPNCQITRLLGLPHVWSEADAAFAPETDCTGKAAEGIWVAGDGAGIGGARIAQLSGELAGLSAAASVGGTGPPGRIRALQARLARLCKARRFLDAVYPPLPLSAHVTEQTLICRCEAVTMAEIRDALADGATGPNRVKAYTRSGMGPCQGRMCGNSLIRLVESETGTPPTETEALRIRPPLKPILIEDYLCPDGEAS